MDFLALNYKMIDEAIKLRNDLKTGKVSVEKYMANMGGMAQVGKMFDRHMRILSFEEKHKTSLRNVGKGMLGYDKEKATLNCIGNKKSITRSQCLDWSGEDPPKFKECVGCPEFRPTRKYLLG